MQDVLLSSPIGGYIELQLPEKKEYYSHLIRLNTGRNSLEYILKVRGYKHVYLPYFTCEVLLEPLQRLSLGHTFYRIDGNLDPVLNFELKPDECFVYTNYFGLKNRTIEQLSEKIDNLIIDNSQAFFAHPYPGVDTFYSCRKFFGVPDGAYLSLESPERLEVENDVSIGRFLHLIKSIDLGIEQAYSDYVSNNDDLLNNQIKAMSPLTRKILAGIDYDTCRDSRNANFIFLHNSLGHLNELKLDVTNLNGPMGYPLLVDRPLLRIELIKRKIFIPTYWPNVFEWACNGMFEYYLASNLLVLPIDHRYDVYEMSQMLAVLKEFI